MKGLIAIIIPVLLAIGSFVTGHSTITSNKIVIRTTPTPGMKCITLPEGNRCCALNISDCYVTPSPTFAPSMTESQLEQLQSSFANQSAPPYTGENSQIGTTSQQAIPTDTPQANIYTQQIVYPTSEPFPTYQPENYPTVDTSQAQQMIQNIQDDQQSIQQKDEALPTESKDLQCATDKKSAGGTWDQSLAQYYNCPN